MKLIDHTCNILHFSNTIKAKDKQVEDLFDVGTKEEYVQREGISNFILE